MVAVQNDGERFGLPLCALGSGAAHGLCVVALLPLIMLSGPSDGGRQPDALTIEVEVITASLPPVPTQRHSSREESRIESVRQAPDTDSAEQTERTSALPPSAEIEIGLPAGAAKSEETSTDGPAADIAQPEEADGVKPEPKVARIKEEPAKPENLSAAKPSTAVKAAVAKPKPAARRTKVQRKVVQNPGKVTSGLQNLFKNLGKSRLNSKPKRARSGSGTVRKSAPAGQANDANPLYFR